MSSTGKLIGTAFVVAGSGRFPVDMLRYDCCYPANGESAEGILSDGAYGGEGMREVRLISCMVTRPTAERWRSFGWVVTAQEDIRS